ncbi:hypothetical protein PG985_003708 [Apiospora marii]|uniref:Uncharacterized protein n=1 Tax=Apiospora marii TaxID=335849 RepID=A0ABR1SHB5_9PEZI
MKYTAIAAATLLPLAWAADDFDSRKGGPLKWKITNLTAAIGDAYGTPYCMYDMMVTASDNPDFSSGVEAGCPSPSGELTGCPPQEDGLYSLSTAAFPENNTLIITLQSRKAMATYNFPISNMDKLDAPADGETIWTGATTVWSYTRNGGELVVETQDLEVQDDPRDDDPAWLVPTGVEWDLASATASGIATAGGAAPVKTTMPSLTASPTGVASAEPSATDAAAASSASDKPGDEHSAATRQSSFAGFVFAVGLMAMVL